MRLVAARAPTRIDFGGGWTDVPPYSEREGGAVCNVAIARYAIAVVTQSPHGDSRHDAPATGLIGAVLSHGGTPRLDVQLSNDFPIAAGLGGSSAAGVALAAAVATHAGETLDLHALALRSRETEVAEMGIPGGYQDHFASAFGGALLLSFSDRIDVDRIPLSTSLAESLARRCIVVYSGESRISGDTISAVRDAWLAGEARVVNALACMKSLAIEMSSALRAEDIDTLATLVDEHWSHQRALHPSISTPRIDQIVETARESGAIGTKALGASGGGCVLSIAAEGREEELARALAPLGDGIVFTIDTAGVSIIEDSQLEPIAS